MPAQDGLTGSGEGARPPIILFAAWYEYAYRIERTYATLEVMKISQATLKRALDQVKLVVEPKSANPALMGVRLLGTPRGLSLCATDLSCWLSTEIQAKETNGALSRVIPAKSLLKVVGALPKKDQLSIVSKDPDGIVLEYGLGQATLSGLEGELFPEPPLPPAAPLLYVPAAAVSQALRGVSYCMCTDETRYHLNGVYLEREGDALWMTATDGHRLARHPFPLEAPDSFVEGSILPAKAVEILLSLFSKSKEQMALSFQEKGFWAQCEGVTLYAVWSQAQYPSYRQVFPVQVAFSLQTSRAALRESALRLHKMASSHQGLHLRPTPEALLVLLKDPELGEVEERLACTTQGLLPPSFQTGINPIYLSEALESLEGELVSLSFVGESDPIVFRGEQGQGVAVVMPMRI